MKSEKHVLPNFLNWASTKQLCTLKKLDTSIKKLDASMNQYNTRNWKSTMKRLHARIKIKTSSLYNINAKENTSSTPENI